jgi:hypothetical protein
MYNGWPSWSVNSALARGVAEGNPHPCGAKNKGDGYLPTAGCLGDSTYLYPQNARTMLCIE